MTRTNRHDGERGQSAIVAVVLLVAVVAVGSTGILLVGLDATDRTSERVEDEQVKRAFVTLDKRMSTVARQESGSREVDLGLGTETDALRKESTGRIVVRTSESSTEILNESIGAIEYDQGGTTYAYQGSGVWQNTGEDATMVSSPDVTYSEASLSLPLTTLSGEDRLEADPVRIEKSETPKFTEYDLVEGEVLIIEVTSEYYGGWAEYFRNEVDNTGVTIDHDNETVIVELGQFQPPDGAFEDGVTATGDVAFGGGSAEINGDVSASGDVDESRVNGDVTEGGSNDAAPIDRIIERKIEAAEDDGSIQRISPDVNVSLTGGNTYYAPNGLHITSAEVADISSGNVTLIVDGDVNIDDDFHVENPSGDNSLRIYASGNISVDNSEFCVYTDGSCGDSTDPKHNQVYGTSEMQVGMDGGSTYFEGTIYAPRHQEFDGNNSAYEDVSNNDKCEKDDTDPTADDYDVCIASGSATYEGSIIAGSTKLAQSATLNHDSSLDTVDPVYADDQTALPPEVTYFTITVYEVEVSDSSDDDS